MHGLELTVPILVFAQRGGDVRRVLATQFRDSIDLGESGPVIGNAVATDAARHLAARRGGVAHHVSAGAGRATIDLRTSSSIWAASR